MIAKADLKPWAYYIGHCRNATIAQWNPQSGHFVYLRAKFGTVFADTVPHPDDDQGFDVFVPVVELAISEDLIKEAMREYRAIPIKPRKAE